MADTEDTKKHGFDTVPVWKTVWRERRSSETMGKRKSEGDKRNVGEDIFFCITQRSATKYVIIIIVISVWRRIGIWIEKYFKFL